MPHACLPHRPPNDSGRTHLVLLYQQLGLLYVTDAVIGSFFSRHIFFFAPGGPKGAL